MIVTGHKSFLWGKILVNGSMKSAKLKQRLMSVHSENASKDVGFISCGKKKIKVGHFQNLDLPFAYLTTKQKKPHTTGKTLVKSDALETVKLVCGLEQRKKLEAFPLSYDVIH